MSRALFCPTDSHHQGPGEQRGPGPGWLGACLGRCGEVGQHSLGASPLLLGAQVVPEWLPSLRMGRPSSAEGQALRTVPSSIFLAPSPCLPSCWSTPERWLRLGCGRGRPCSRLQQQRRVLRLGGMLVCVDSKGPHPGRMLAM